MMTQFDVYRDFSDETGHSEAEEQLCPNDLPIRTLPLTIVGLGIDLNHLPASHGCCLRINVSYIYSVNLVCKFTI